MKQRLLWHYKYGIRKEILSKHQLYGQLVRYGGSEEEDVAVAVVDIIRGVVEHKAGNEGRTSQYGASCGAASGSSTTNLQFLKKVMHRDLLRLPEEKIQYLINKKSQSDRQ